MRNLVVVLSVLLLAIGASAGTETVLWSFGGSGDPPYPQGYLISDDVENLYGLTGGLDNEGTVFKLSPIGNGGWKEVILYSFRPRGSGERRRRRISQRGFSKPSTWTATA